MSGEGFIETGVDKLVKLVESKKKVSTTEAAKLLGVSPAVIDEWADFLEEEGIISIDYKLATTYLVERKLSKKEVVKKAKEFHGSKDAFVRKIETAIQGIDRDTSGLDELRDKFKELKEEIGGDVNHVKDELKQLEVYEKLKKNIDKQMYEQQDEFRKKIQEMEKEVFKERNRYKELLDDIEVERIRLQEEKSDLISLKEQEAKLLSKLEGFKDIISEIRKNIKQEEDKIDVTDDHIKYLEKVCAKIKENVAEQSSALDPLIKESKKQEELIEKQQSEILKKIADGKKKVKADPSESKKVQAKFQAFFSQKAQIEKMLSKVETDKLELEKELNDLIRKAHAFDLASKSTNVKKYMTELNKKFKEIEKKRGTFKTELNKLIGVIKKHF